MLVSVIIPVLNEQDALPQTLASISLQEEPVEVVVVDGGSGDASRAIAVDAGATLLVAPRGRARQMNAGARASRGPLLLFLHADTQLPAGALRAARAAIRQPGTVGGCFRLRFDSDSRLLRFSTARFWMQRRALVFGDRAIFASRDAFEAADGFPEVPLFEDAEFVRRISQTGRFALLDEAVVTSARRFVTRGVVRQQGRNVLLWAAWRLGVPPARLARWYSST